MMGAWLKRGSGAAAAIAIAGLLGCGGGGQSSSSSSSSSSRSGSESGGGGSTALSKAEFVEQANAACAKEKKGASARAGLYIKTHESDGLSEEALGRRAFNNALLSTAEGEVAALRELEPPASEEKKLEAALAAEEAAIDKGKKGEAKLELEETEHLFVASNGQMRALGLTKCVFSS